MCVGLDVRKDRIVGEVAEGRLRGEVTGNTTASRMRRRARMPGTQTGAPATVYRVIKNQQYEHVYWQDEHVEIITTQNS
jgi:hypothetical protein